MESILFRLSDDIVLTNSLDHNVARRIEKTRRTGALPLVNSTDTFVAVALRDAVYKLRWHLAAVEQYRCGGILPPDLNSCGGILPPL